MKYELLDNDTIEYKGRTLKRIKRIADGKLGGYIEFETNLSQRGTCWVHEDAKVYEDAHVDDDAQIMGNACVHGHAAVAGSAVIAGNAIIHGRAEVYNCARIGDEAQVFGWSKVYGNSEIKGRSSVHGDAKVCDAILIDTEVLDRVELYTNVIIKKLQMKGNGSMS